MKDENFTSNSNLLDNFVSKSIELEEDISKALMNLEELYLEDIVGLYFNMINVSSIAKSINQNNRAFENKNFEENLNKIKEIQSHLNEKFNETLHPMLISNLEKRIEEYKSNLKKVSINHDATTKKEIEGQAEKFEKLRQLMSTKEFVNQYTKVLGN